MRSTTAQRFHECYAVHPMTGCWEWTAGRTRQNRYGRVQIGNGELMAAHRFAYQLEHGDLGDDLVVRHTCDNALCVNPAHLVPGTQAQNMEDMVQRNRSAKGERHSQALLTATDVERIRDIARFGGHTQLEIANYLGFKRKCVGDVLRGRTWSHAA